MTIEELIGRLYAMRSVYGNVEVEVRNQAGDFDDVSSLAVVHVGGLNKLQINT